MAAETKQKEDLEFERSEVNLGFDGSQLLCGDFTKAIQSADWDVARRYVEENSESVLTASDEDGRSALHLLAQAPDTGDSDGVCSLIKGLVQSKADLHSRDLLGETPLSLSVHTIVEGPASEHTVCRTLLELRSDPNLADSLNGETPLMEAASAGNCSLCSLLLSFAADVRQVSYSGISALSLAEVGGHDEAVALLRNAGAGSVPAGGDVEKNAIEAGGNRPSETEDTLEAEEDNRRAGDAGNGNTEKHVGGHCAAPPPPAEGNLPQAAMDEAGAPLGEPEAGGAEPEHQDLLRRPVGETEKQDGEEAANTIAEGQGGEGRQAESTVAEKQKKDEAEGPGGLCKYRSLFGSDEAKSDDPPYRQIGLKPPMRKGTEENINSIRPRFKMSTGLGGRPIGVSVGLGPRLGGPGFRHPTFGAHLPTGGRFSNVASSAAKGKEEHRKANCASSEEKENKEKREENKEKSQEGEGGKESSTAAEGSEEGGGEENRGGTRADEDKQRGGGGADREEESEEEGEDEGSRSFRNAKGAPPGKFAPGDFPIHFPKRANIPLGGGGLGHATFFGASSRIADTFSAMKPGGPATTPISFSKPIYTFGAATAATTASKSSNTTANGDKSCNSNGDGSANAADGGGANAPGPSPTTDGSSGSSSKASYSYASKFSSYAPDSRPPFMTTSSVPPPPPRPGAFGTHNFAGQRTNAFRATRTTGFAGGFFNFGPGGPYSGKSGSAGKGRGKGPSNLGKGADLAQHFAILGLPATASLEQVRKMYRKLVLQFHPDKNKDPEAAAKFLKIQQAYEVLCRRLA